MKVAYNNFVLSDLGEVTLTKRHEYEGGDAPQRAKVTLTVKLMLFERSYADNYARLDAAREALALPNAVLIWQNDDTGETYANQTATLMSADWPEEWGTYVQELNLSFVYYENLDTSAQNLPLTFVLTSGPNAQTINLDRVTGWNEGGSTERFSSLRSHRRETRGRLEVKGVIYGDPSVSLPTRRAALATQVVALRRAMNAAEGKLTFGSGAQTMFDGVVRVVDFRAEVNQAIAQIEYSFTAVYTLFPNEADYATAEAAIAVTDNMTGELVLNVSGKIEAPDEAKARTKLNALLAAILAQYGYAAGQQLQLDTTSNLISANGDGDTFTELAFAGRWRRWRESNLKATLLAKGNNGDPVTLGQVRQWVDNYSATRFDDMRDQRRVAINSIELAGTLPGDAGLPLAERRTALLAMQRRLKGEANAASSTLVYGTFSQAVRVDDFKAEINQAETGIDWTLKAHYTLFPDEATYATCEATADEKNNFSGELALSVNGKIQAATEAAARTKLAAVLATFLAAYGYDAPVGGTPAQQLELNVSANQISANADGNTFTELTFAGSWRKWSATNQVASFQATGHKAALSFGNVRVWEDGYKADRFDVMRSERRHATGTISASGTLAGDARLALKDRRAALLALQRKLKAECNSAEGVLKYGDWTQVVRMEEFIAHVNQAETGIDWAFTASYSLFPNEGGYATAEFTADVRDDIEAGDRYLSFAGEIDAPNGSLARAKLASLRAATLGIYGFAVGQAVRLDAVAREISANGDATSTVPEGIETEGDVAGVTFLRLSFNEEYRQRMPGTVLNSQFTISSRDDTATGLLLTTYAGSVTATGVTADAATAAAMLRAIAIGGDKEMTIDAGAFLKSKTMTIERRQTSATVPEEFIRLSFSYEYQSKLGAGRAYLEMTTNVALDAFSPDTESVNGFVVAKDFVTATAIYQQQARAIYKGRMIRSETVTQGVAQAATPGTDDTMVFKTQQLRLEFSFSVHRDKPAGRVTARYAISVSRNFSSLKRISRVRGSVYASTRAAADTFLSYVAKPLGSLMESSRDEDHDYQREAAPGSELDVFTKLDFDDVYEDRLTDVAGVIEMRVTESVTYSAIRWAMQPIPFASNGGNGISVPQAAGLTEGSRTIRGSVSGATRSVCEAWAYRHRKLLTGDRSGNSCPLPEQIDTDYDFVPRVDGIAADDLAGAGTKANVQIYRVSFTFGEILPNYLPAT